jgi:hypothetical protein
MFNTPVLIIIFNRPETTKLLIEVLRNIKPKYLYVSADGPRINNENDLIKCGLTREIIFNDIDWDCEVNTLFHENNKGCRIAPATAISWFFSHVDKGLIIEDDCIVDLSFFKFAEELLKKYEFDERVMHISASSTFKKVSNKSFSFSNYPLIWGWATWRRAWEKYDILIPDWNSRKEQKDLFFYQKDKKLISYLEHRFDSVFNYSPDDNISGDSNAWDYQWWYCLIKLNGLSIIPKKNLVKNVGFGEHATHTLYKKDDNANRQTFSMNFPLDFPKDFSTNKANSIIEKEFLNVNVKSKNTFTRLRTKIKHLFKSLS